MTNSVSEFSALFLVKRLCAEFEVNCAHWVKSLKFCVKRIYVILTDFGYGATAKI